jgi:hypothetical protein
MIEFKLQLTELPDKGGVKVHYDTPPAPDATKAEIQLAQKIVKKLQFFMKTKAAAIQLPPEPRRIILPGSERN